MALIKKKCPAAKSSLSVIRVTPAAFKTVVCLVNKADSELIRQAIEKKFPKVKRIRLGT